MRIAFWGNFGALNLGNECTLAATVANMRARLPSAQLVSICRGPGDTVARHAIGAVPMCEPREPPERGHVKPLRMLGSVGLELLAWGRAFLDSAGIDALLVTGSGILSDENEGMAGVPYQLFKWALLTRLRGKKLFFVSVGAESLTRPLSRALVKGALRLAHYRSYRDAHSAKVLKALGFDTDRDAIRPDLAFSLPAPTVASPGAVSAASRQRRVAVGLFNYRGRGLGSPADAAAYQVYLDRMCSLILWLLARGDAVRVVIGDFAYDVGVCQDVRAELARRGLDLSNPAFSDDPAASFEQMLEQLASVDVVIASRYHNVVLGLFLGKLVLSLSYEPKHDALMRDMGLGEYCQSIDDFTLERVVEQLQRLERDADSLRPVIVERAAANRARLDEQYDLIVRRIYGPVQRQ
jgi:polysaccharide pyruvyl transferase WcaK-like protein